MNADEQHMSNVITLLDQLNDEMPDLLQQAEVVGRWVWIEFHTPPLTEIRTKLRDLGFHWNRGRKCWQNPCGIPRPRSRRDPKSFYPVTPATALALNEAPPQTQRVAREYKVVALRECPLPENLLVCDTPERAAEYWQLHVATNPYFNPDCECFVVLMLNTRRRVKAHQLVTIGTMDTLLVHPREVFRASVIAGASAVILMHNHPSGEPDPSEADIKVTRDLIRAGQLMKIEVLDHVIMGANRHQSLRVLGYFYS